MSEEELLEVDDSIEHELIAQYVQADWEEYMIAGWEAMREFEALHEIE